MIFWTNQKSPLMIIRFIVGLCFAFLITMVTSFSSYSRCLILSETIFLSKMQSVKVSQFTLFQRACLEILVCPVCLASRRGCLAGFIAQFHKIYTSKFHLVSVFGAWPVCPNHNYHSAFPGSPRKIFSASF